MREAQPTAETQKFPTLDELLVVLQNNMRLYDELTPQLEALRMLQESKNAGLIDYDLEAAAQQRLEDVAFAALDKVIMDAKVTELEQQIAEYENSNKYYSQVHKGRRIVVMAWFPDKKQIEDYYLDGGGYAGKQRDRQHGKLTNIGLRPSDGGFIKFKSRTRLHQAGPLFDRENDYQPLFDITEV